MRTRFLISTRNASLASFSYTVTIRVNLFEWKACKVLSGMIISKKCPETAVGLGLGLQYSNSLSFVVWFPNVCVREKMDGELPSGF